MPVSFIVCKHTKLHHMEKKYSIIIPAFNEEGGIANMLTELFAAKIDRTLEIIVVNDASTDGTENEVAKFPVRLVSNIQNSGYGYSLKHGIQLAAYDNIIITDADGTYPVGSISALITEYEKGFDMVVGARQGKFYRGTLLKRIARFFFKRLSEFTSGRKIPDINSGFRVFDKVLAVKFFNALSSGFSFTTTITLAFMLNSYSVKYIPISYHDRKGLSKVKYFRDTLRSAQIIIEAIVLYNPLKLFLLCIVCVWVGALIALCVGYYFSVFVAFLFFCTLAVSLVLFGFGCVIVFLRLARHHVSELH